jgi:flavin reductase (DIM6/NTAB) family NADH-FMN oxidoreductase RutF
MDPFEFRQLCGRFATGIAIVTTTDASGKPAGMTVNSFSSVSLEPPLVLVAIDRAASMHTALEGASGWAINILEAHQETLSRRFASGLPDRFEGVGWHAGPGGEILLEGALAHLWCEPVSSVPTGDHTVFVGKVIGGEAAEHGRPLLYYRGGYAELDGL